MVNKGIAVMRALSLTQLEHAWNVFPGQQTIQSTAGQDAWKAG